ncbi:MAG: TIGR01777 family protein [Anaerolineales bacterium]|nr:TIGR01777 family protein [Anaerolineales bacterium]
MKWIITGGTGMIGRELAANLVEDGQDVIIVSRNPAAKKALLPPQAHLEAWDGETTEGWGHLIDGADVVVNMAGERIAGPNPFTLRWTEARKRRICDSRANAGKAVTQAIEAATRKPAVVVQFSGADYYSPTVEHATEETPAGEGFLSIVCSECWESSTESLETLGVRRIVTRISPVLHPKDGALPPLVLQSKLFVGGPLGSGKQSFSWVHIDDLIRAIRFLVDSPHAGGAFNVTAPNPLTNGEFVRVLGKVLGRPSFVPVPGFVLRLLFGEMASTLLEGPRVYPERLQELGFTFKFPEAEAALKDLLK